MHTRPKKDTSGVTTSAHPKRRSAVGGISMFTKGDRSMIASIAGAAPALQLGLPAHPLNESIPLVQEIRYCRHGRPPPCGNGYDLDERDDKCYPNGTVPRTSGIVGWPSQSAPTDYRLRRDHRRRLGSSRILIDQELQCTACADEFVAEARLRPEAKFRFDAVSAAASRCVASSAWAAKMATLIRARIVADNSIIFHLLPSPIFGENLRDWFQ